MQHQTLSGAGVLHTGIEVEDGFDFMSEEYRGFYNGERGTAFQAPLWMDTIHRRLVPALGATQRTVTVRNRKDGSLVAVLPMVMQRSAGISIMQPADFGICDYNSVVADPLRLAQLASDAEAKDALRQTMKGADLLMFRKVRSDGFNVSLLFDGMKASAGENAANAIEVGEDFEHWRNRVLRKKFTKELGRLQRQTERENGSYEHRLLTEESEIARAFEFLREAQGDRPHESLLGNPLYFDFYKDYAIAGARSGEAQTYASFIGGEIAAALFGPTGDGQFHAVLIGADMRRFEKISAGIQIIYRVVEMRFQEGFRTLDMGLGDSGYKSHFRPSVTPMRNFTLSRTPAGAVMAFVYHRSKPLKNLLKGFMPNVR